MDQKKVECMERASMTYHLSFDLSFTQNIYPGKYYALEGIDGSGKSTQVEKLSKYFTNLGEEVFVTKEPTEGIIGNLIKKIIHEEIKVSPISLQYLFGADRALHLQDEVIPALKMGKIVLSDRSLWSAVAYGIADLDLQDKDKERLLVAYNVLSMYGSFLIPDKTFIISVTSKIAMERVIIRSEEITLYEKEDRLKKVEKIYTWMAEKFSDNLKIIDGTKSKEEVFELVVGSL